MSDMKSFTIHSQIDDCKSRFFFFVWDSIILTGVRQKKKKKGYNVGDLNLSFTSFLGFTVSVLDVD